MNLASKILKAKVLQKVVTTQAEETQFLANISPVQGDSYISTTSGNAILKVYDGTKWIITKTDYATYGDIIGVTDGKLDSTALGNFTFDTDTLKNTNSSAKITLGSDGSQYIPDSLTVTAAGISRNNLDDGIGANNWSITGGGNNSPTMTVGSKSETLENIITAPSKIDSKADAEDVATISNDMTLVKASINNLSSDKQDKLTSGTNIKTINGESVLGSGDITVTPTIDSALSDSSENAVQNKVVKAAIDGKLDKVKQTSVLYCTDSTGIQTILKYNHNPEGGSVVRYATGGVVNTNTPTENNNAANKKYVDNAITNNVYEANLKWGGKNFADNYGCIDAAMISTLGADRFRGISVADGITIEYSRDSGATWIDYGASDILKKALFIDDFSGVRIGKSTSGTEITADYKVRIILDGYKLGVYTQLNKFAIYVSTDGSKGCTVTIDGTPSDNSTTDNYTRIFAQNVPISGWSGWNIINVPTFALRMNSSITTQTRKLRFTFSITEQHDTQYTGLSVLALKAFGGVGWSQPSYESKYGSPFLLNSSGYRADRPFNFVQGAAINSKPIATQQYVTDNAATKAELNKKYDKANGLTIEEGSIELEEDTDGKYTAIYNDQINMHDSVQDRSVSISSYGIDFTNGNASNSKDFTWTQVYNKLQEQSSPVDVVDNLTSTSTTSALSANQGKVLNDKLDLKYDLASGVGLNDYDVSVISENGDLMSDVYAGDISVTQVNGSSGLSGGIKIDNSVPTLYSGSKSETIENVIDSVIASGLTDEIAKNYNIVSSKNWTKTSSGGGMLGEAQYNEYYPLVYNQPVNEEVIKLAKIINAETNAVLATFTSVEELDSNTHTTAYHFGDNFTIIVIHEQEGDYTQLYDGRIPPYSWVNGFSYGVYLCGALLNTSGEYWYAENIPNTANLRIEFPTPLVAPKGSRTAIGGTYFTREKYIFYDDGRRECEILACAENVAITSSWGSLYEGSLGSFSFLTGFFTTEPEMSVEMCNTLNSEESGGVACFIETGVKPSTTSTGVLYAVRPNGSGVGKRIYFKIHARQV